MRLVPWACGLSALVAVAEAALFARNSPVLHLTPNNFDKEVLEVHKPALVAFTAPWCGYCRNLAPSFERVAAELDGVVKIAYVDCDDSASQALCAKYEIKGFPTIKLFPATKRRVPRDYLGERKGKAMMNYVLDALPSEAVRKLDASSLPAFLAKGSTPKIVLVTPMGKTSPMLRSLALDYLKRIPFAHVFAGKDGVVESMQKQLDPELTKDKLPGLYFVAHDDKPVKYRGSMKYRYIKLWIDERLGGAEAQAARLQREAEAKAKADQEAEARARIKERMPSQEESTYGMKHNDDNVEQLRKFEEAFVRMNEDEAMQQIKQQTDRAYIKKLLDARAKLMAQEGVQDSTPQKPLTKGMLMDKLQEHMGEKYGLRLADHAEQTQKTIERKLMEHPDDTVGAMNEAEHEFIALLRDDQAELETQIQARADLDGYVLSQDAIDAMNETLETILGLINTIEFRISARTAGLDERQTAEKMLNQFHDEL